MTSIAATQDCTVKDEISQLLLNEPKFCRICLEEQDADDDDSMIAPCMCKGTSKWVHRHCLDSWRTNEPDRAFAQCTECHYTYHLISSNHQHPSSLTSTNHHQPLPSSFWAQPRVTFCLFVSRDICTITILMQLLIASLGYMVMIFDKSQHWDLTHLILNPSSACEIRKTYSGYDATTPSFWCRHDEAAVYYLFGIILLLAIIGSIGSIIFCRNGCSLNNNDLTESANQTRGDDNTCKDTNPTSVRGPVPSITTIPATRISVMERGMIKTNESGMSYVELPIQPNHSRHQRRSTEYYRRQRQNRIGRLNTSDESCCCDIWWCMCSDRCTTTNHYIACLNPPTCCCDCADLMNDNNGNGDDCCCSCCDCPAHHVSSASSASVGSHQCNCGDGDSPVAIILFILLVFFVILAIIGLFLLLVMGVIVCQRVVQRHIFLLQKQSLVQEFQVADLSSIDENHIKQNNDSITSARLTDQFVQIPDTLHPNDLQRLQKLGLLDFQEQ